MKRVYFDNASTTKTDNEVLNEMLPYFSEYFGNASSVHSQGKTAKVLLEDARDTVAAFIGANPREIFFVNSGTEAANFALKGTAFKFLGTGKRHIITTSIEHLAVLDTVRYLESKFNFEVTYIRPTSDGKINTEDIKAAVRPDTFLISVMHSNNETGNINDIKEITEAANENNIIMHTDSVQSIGKVRINVKDLNVNFASVSAHKIYGPKGIAALYIKDRTPVEKFIHGGKQERDMRGGTENIPAAAGFRKAVELADSRFQKDTEHYQILKKHLTEKLKGLFGEYVMFNSDNKNCLPNIINVSFDRDNLIYDEEMLLIKLDLKGISVSGGSACTAGTHKPSHVLLESGRDRLTALGSLRISFGRENNTEETDYFAECLKEIIRIR